MSADVQESVDMTGWSPEQIEEYKKLQAELAEEDEQLALMEAAEKARENSPDFLLAQRKAELEERRAERLAKERAAKEDETFAELQAKHGGDRVARHDMVKSMIVLLCPGQKEVDTFSQRFGKLSDPVNKAREHRNYITSQVIYPEKAPFETIAKDYPGLWVDLTAVSDDLISGQRAAFQKKAMTPSRRSTR